LFSAPLVPLQSKLFAVRLLPFELWVPAILSRQHPLLVIISYKGPPFQFSIVQLLFFLLFGHYSPFFFRLFSLDQLWPLLCTPRYTPRHFFGHSHTRNDTKVPLLGFDSSCLPLQLVSTTLLAPIPVSSMSENFPDSDGFVVGQEPCPLSTVCFHRLFSFDVPFPRTHFFKISRPTGAPPSPFSDSHFFFQTLDVL